MNDSIKLALYIQPKASRDEWVGWYGDEYKLAITAPPVDGKANEYVIKLLAKTFKVPKKNIIILSGELSRHKRVEILSPSVIPDALDEMVSSFKRRAF